MISYSLNWMEGDRIDFQSRYIDFYPQQQQKLSQKDKNARKMYKRFRQLGVSCAFIMPKHPNKMSKRSSKIIHADS